MANRFPVAANPSREPSRFPVARRSSRAVAPADRTIVLIVLNAVSAAAVVIARADTNAISVNVSGLRSSRLRRILSR